MKKAIALILALLMAFTLFACKTADKPATPSEPAAPPATTTPSNPAPPTTSTSPAPPSPVIPPSPPEPPPKDKKFAEHIDIMSNNMVPAVISAFSPAGIGAPAQWVYRMITDRLLAYVEATGEYVPELATKWETSDNKTIRFYLRDDVYYHNGEHFTAEDVKWTIEISREFPGSLAAGRWASVETVNVIDKYTVELVLKGPNAGFFALLASAGCGMYNSKAYKEQPDTWTWIGTGPFFIKEFSTNEYTTVQRNDNFWGELTPTRTMTFRFVPEEAIRTVMMLNGEFDFSLGIRADDLELFEKDPNFVILPRTLTSPISIGFNMTDPLMSDRNFRMAVYHALDGYDVGVVAEGAPGIAKMNDSNIWGYSSQYRKWDFPRYEQDIPLAKEYLAKTAYAGETIEIVAGAPPFIRGAEMIQEMLGQIGINCSVKATDQPGLFAHVAYGNNKSQMHFFCPEMSYSPFLSARNNFTPGPLNRTSYTNPRITELIEKAEASTDPAVHKACFEEIQDLVFEDLPFIPLFWREFGDVGVSTIGGFGPSGTSTEVNFRGLFMTIDD